MSAITLPKHRLEWIDSLRGIAALLVVVLHLWQSLFQKFHIEGSAAVNVLAYIIYGVIDFGKTGVVAFFLISGFVIPYSFKGKNNKQFFINRFFRLYPAYWASILFFVIFVALPPAKNLLINLTMFQRFLGTEDLIGAFWTLQIELIFYFLCATLHYFKLLENDKLIIKLIVFFVVLALIVATARFYLDKKLPVALFLALAVMFIGLSWRRFAMDRSTYITKPLMYKILGLFILLLLPITLLAYSKDYGHDEAWYRYFLSYLTALGLFFIFFHYKFVNKALLYLGSISYSLYLLHAVFGLEVSSDILKLINVNNVYLYVLLFFLLSFASASLCYFFIEKPCVKLGKKIFLKHA